MKRIIHSNKKSIILVLGEDGIYDVNREITQRSKLMGGVRIGNLQHHN